jgi:3'-phosphoadenosine 5'-phosphosulfate sulfotransferase (PAPS reductase)/FAD synthetase
MNNRGVDRDNEAGTIFPREQSPSVASTLSAIDHRDLTNHFVTAMDRLGPFEPCPHLAVAVSGGADSMALTLLAGDWAVRRGGEVLALTVDHGLRAASSTEAAS